jgi:ATP-dependent protease ClpP protease subunit
MKKLIASILGVLILMGVAATPLHSTQIISEQPAIILIDDFYTSSYADLYKATLHLRKGDTLKIISQGPGGNAFVCVSMFNLLHELKDRGVNIVTEIAGLAASANAIVWLIGDERIMHEHDIVMFHKVVMRGQYNAILTRENMNEAQRLIYDTLNNWIRQALLDIVHDTELVNKMLGGNDATAEYWINGEQAYKLGIATKLIGG